MDITFDDLQVSLTILLCFMGLKIEEKQFFLYFRDLFQKKHIFESRILKGIIILRFGLIRYFIFYGQTKA